MELKEIFEKVAHYSEEANKHRATMNTAHNALAQAKAKETDGMQKTIKFLEGQMSQLVENLSRSIFLLETYYLMLDRKRPSQKTDREYKNDLLANLRNTLLGVYHGPGFNRERDPQKELPTIAEELAQRSAHFFMLALTTRDPDLLYACLYIDDPQAKKANGLKNTPLVLAGLRDVLPLFYTIQNGDAVMAEMLCKHGAKISQEDFKAAVELCATDVNAELTQEELADKEQQARELVCVLLRNGYQFDENVLGYLTQQWDQHGHAAIDYMMKEGALSDTTLMSFKAAISAVCTDMQFDVICGNEAALYPKLRQLSAKRVEDLTAYIGVLKFAAFAGREQMTRYLLNTNLMAALFKQDNASQDIGAVLEQVRSPAIREMFESVALQHGVTFNAGMLDEAVVLEGRDALGSSTDFIRAYVEQKEVARYRKGGNSWTSYLWDTNNPKANAIEAAMKRADTARQEQDMGAEEYLNHKQGSLSSVAEELAAPRIGFFSATGYTNALDKLKEFRAKRAEQEQQEQSEHKNGM